MPHREAEARQLGYTGRDADRYGHTGGPMAEPQGPPPEDAIDPFEQLTNEQLQGIIYDIDSYPEDVTRAAAILESRGFDPMAEEDGGGGGPTPEQLAIERSKVASANMANYIDAVTRGLNAEIDAKRLSTEQAMEEFNRQLDAMTEARTGFLGAQQWTIPEGATEIHADIRERLDMEPWIPDPIEYDPFGMALDIIQSTPELTGIGVPETGTVQKAIELAEQFL